MTLKLIKKHFTKDEIFLFVEPQDFQKYYEKYNEIANVIDIKENDKGIGFARNFVLSFLNDANFIWMLDDDIYGFKIKKIDGRLENISDLRMMVEIMIETMIQNDFVVFGTRNNNTVLKRQES